MKVQMEKTTEPKRLIPTRTERLIAWASFISADAMGFAAVIINDEHDILSGQLWFIAQMLLLCATLLGIDLTIHKYLKK